MAFLLVSLRSPLWRQPKEAHQSRLVPAETWPGESTLTIVPGNLGRKKEKQNDTPRILSLGQSAGGSC